MANPKYRVLVVDDEANQRTALASMVQAWGYEAMAAEHGAQALELLPTFQPGVVVTDLMMPVMDGQELLRRLREIPGAPPSIVLTAFGNLEMALNTMHELGAFWFLEKPLEPAALKLLLQRALEQHRLKTYSEGLQRELVSKGVLGKLVGSSKAMQEIFLLVQQVGPTRATVLITGESGTGKELVARAIHETSPRRDGPFIAVNCAALTETLIESELFGHEKGAFTGAVERRQGCFELAVSGTLLLDEIGEMPLATQAKLLRVLEDRKFRRLGGSRELDVDVRVLASTNRDLLQASRQGTFREDLYFRLNVFQVDMPTLRERKSDIPLLVEAMIRDMNEKHQCRVTGLNREAVHTLESHDWPGNVRELRNVLERAVILTGEGEVHARALGMRSNSEQPATIIESDAESIRLPVGTSVSEAEKALIELTLRHTGQNRTRAAALLGISQKTLFNKLKGYESEEP